MQKTVQKDKILAILLSEIKISPEDLNEAKNIAKLTGKPIENILVEKKIIGIEDLAKVKAKIYGLPYENLADKKIDEKVIHIIPIEVSRNYKVICFDKVKDTLKIGIVDPQNLKAREAIDFLGKREELKAKYYLISEISFDEASRNYRTFDKEIFTALKDKAEEEEEIKFIDQKSAVQLEDFSQTAPVVRIVSVIIRHAIDGLASDIHIEPLKKESRVRYRIDGILHTSLILPKSIHNAIVARIKVLANLKLDETRIPQDGRMRVSVNNQEIDLRISVMPLLDSEKVVMRILDLSRAAPDLHDLGFIGSPLRVIEKNIKKTEGLFLLTGPTGSGKSTTLFSILNRMNSDNINISTLEDPIEYFIEGANQSQIRPEIGFTFAAGLRYLLRQDPNIIMVGEIRDEDTVELAIHAGLTGHFVLSTLHTNDSLGAITRLKDMGVEPFLLSSTLNTVVAQRLARKICKNCKVEATPPANILEQIRNDAVKIPAELIKELVSDFNPDSIKIYKGAGCARCGQSGYIGRIAVAEVIDVNEGIKDLIADKNKIIKLEDVRKNQQFITMKQDGIIKVLQGITTIEEVLRIIYD